MKNFKKRLVALCLSAALIIPVVGSAVVAGVGLDENVSTCCANSPTSTNPVIVILDDDGLELFN